MENSKESKEVQEAIANGADPEVIKSMQEEGTLAETPEAETKEEGAEHVEKDSPEKEDKDEKEEVADDQEFLEDGVTPNPKYKKPEEAKEEGAEDEEGEGPNRTVKHIPAWKAKELAKKAKEEGKTEAKAEFDAELKALALQGKGQASDEDVTAFAEEFNITPEVATSMIDKLASVLEKKTGLSELRKDIDERKARDIEIAEQQGFENEFSHKDTQEALKAIAGDREISSEVKEKVKELAYSSTYARYRLTDIIKLEGSVLFPEAPKASKTAETGKGGSQSGQAVKSIEDMTPEEIGSMTDEEFLKASDELGKKGNRFNSITRAKKK